jgi:hypothetical protein
MMITNNLRCKVFDKKIIVQEVTKDQKKIFELCGVIVPRVLGI